MNTGRTAAIAVAMAAGALAPVALASSAQAVPITHDGCTLSVVTPQFTNHWTVGGVKKIDYRYQLTCNPSAAGVSVEITHERWEVRPGRLVRRPERCRRLHRQLDAEQVLRGVGRNEERPR